MTIVNTITEQTTIAELAAGLARSGLSLTCLRRAASHGFLARVARTGHLTEYAGLGPTASDAINRALEKAGAP